MANSVSHNIHTMARLPQKQWSNPEDMDMDKIKQYQNTAYDITVT